MSFKKQVLQEKEQLIAATRELIQIQSVKGKRSQGMPFGQGMHAALCYVLDLAEDMGFRVKNLDGYCGYAEYGEGEFYIGVLSHVDTYEAGDMWAIPPYEARIVNDRIYGRGAMDNKGPLMAALFALKMVKDSGKLLNKKIRLIVGTDEQRYFEDMAHYLAREAPPIAGFTLDGQFPIVYAEKGLAMMEYRTRLSQSGEDRIAYITGGKAENTVPGHCEALLITERKSELVAELLGFARENRHNMQARLREDGVLIESFGVETHSMALESGINAIPPLIRFLRQSRFGCREIQDMVAFWDDRLGFDIYGESLAIGCSDGFSGRLTLNFGTLEFNGSEAVVRLDLRFPVTCDFTATAARLKETFEANGFRETEHTAWNPVYFPKDHFLIDSLLKVYRKVTRDKGEPIVSGSGSYSKVIPNIAAFGAIFPGESQAWHQINEYIEIGNLLKMAEIYAEAIYELGTTL